MTRYIVTTHKGQPLKLGGFKYAVEAIAMPVELWDATRFDTRRQAVKRARKMWNLDGFEVKPLIPLDQQ